MGPVAAAVYGHPSTALTIVGITGTNGKTTTAHLLASILRQSGRTTGVIGTLSGPHTTPEAPELQAKLAGFRDDGYAAVVMEVSSHALALQRVDGTRFAAAVFTNLGRDHLDLHGSAQAYFRAKARLFTPELSAVGVTNVDDAHGRLLRDAGTIPIVPFSAIDAADVEVTAASHAFTWRGERIEVSLGGSFNVMNSLAAATTASVLGVGPEDIAAGLGAAGPVPGRFERVGAGESGVGVVVDYAHTPDGLGEVLTAARDVTGGRVIVVFGCGGDRDRAKRPQMGGVAARLADLVVVTSDNPRSESPAAIIDEVVAGIAPADWDHVTVEPDRAAAIATALDLAQHGDVVVVAGKGHETTQTFGDRVVEFDDREVARRLLEAR
jgi:UDP-N-acetylmuramoyl-L-alanyl-D-glutamate--2,6-diaminopimelate ligase